jgi:ribosome-binding ATPase
VVDISGSLDSEGQEISEGAYNPIEDIFFLEKEIDYWFKDIITREDWQKFTRKIEQEKLSFLDMLEERLAGISVKRHHILQAMSDSQLNFEHLTNWTDDDLLKFSSILRKISKPIIIAANKIDKPTSLKNLEELQKVYHDKVIPCTALAEYWLRKYAETNIIHYKPGGDSFQILEKEQLKETELKSLNSIQTKILDKFNNTGIQEILNYAVYQVLNQIVVYPVYDAQNYTDKDGNVLPDAFLVSKGTLLKKFVETKIHSELAKNFIYGINARTKMRLGENYQVENNDIIRIVSAAKGK